MAERRYNPYTYGNPAITPGSFYGWERELSIIMNTISHAMPGQRQSMAVVGPRRIGKTSLLYQVLRLLEDTFHIAAFISTEQFVPPLPLELTKEILIALQNDAVRKKLSTGKVQCN